MSTTQNAPDACRVPRYKPTFPALFVSLPWLALFGCAPPSDEVSLDASAPSAMAEGSVPSSQGDAAQDADQRSLDAASEEAAGPQPPPPPECPPGTRGCPCDAGTCTAGLSCDDGTCETAETSQPEDPECGDAEISRCDALGRVCIPSAHGDASCGECHAGLLSEGEACVSAASCGDSVCSPQEYCDTLGDLPVCRARPCALGEAQTPHGECAQCTVASCEDVEGSTGRFWAFSTVAGDCLCETQPGYFHTFGGVGLPIACDADGDGWTREEIREVEERGDEILRQNLRCSPATVTRVSLRDEYGIESHVWSCEEGLIQQDERPDCELFPLRLLETKRNDVAGEIAKSRGSVDANRADPYGARDFRPEELNALTKACSTAAADYNDDGRPDVDEVQDAFAQSEQGRLASFAHFLELHAGSFEPASDGQEHGRLVIRERSRCDASDFRLAYEQEPLPFSPRVPASHWRTCYRRRDARFDLDQPAPGLDFAQWTTDPFGHPCPDRGSCPGLPPPHPSIDARDGASETPFGQGACSLDGATPADGLWRGLHHASQFKCVVISDADNPSLPERPVTNLETAGSAFNRCGLHSCAPGTVDCTEGLACETVPLSTLEPGDVGWEALGYDGNYDAELDEYRYGCVNEDVQWSDLMCGAFLEVLASSDDVANFGLGGAFGKSSCDRWAVFAPADAEPLCDPDVRVLPLFFVDDTGDSCNGSVLAP